jgi:hypothetical protein
MLKERLEAQPDLAAHEHTPLFVVATEGGGIRAAYWTAAVLEKLDALAQVRGIDFRANLLAISSVSGGSVGTGAWVAGVRHQLCNPMPEPFASQAAAVPEDIATRALSTDFLSPTIGMFFYPDFIQHFLFVPFQPLSRARGLEEGWQRAMAGVPGKPLELTMREFYDPGCRKLPIMLFNSTDAQTGQRAIFSPLEVSKFVDVWQEPAHASTLYQSMAELMHHSARFPVISPAGSVIEVTEGDSSWLSQLYPRPLIRLVDGGYHDNSGVITALDLVRKLRDLPAEAGLEKDSPLAKVARRPVVLIVLTGEDYRECEDVATGASTVATRYCRLGTTYRVDEKRPFRWLHETLPILAGLYNVRESHQHNTVTRAMLQDSNLCTAVLSYASIGQAPAAGDKGPVPAADETASAKERITKAPLGWALSNGAIRMLHRAAYEQVRLFVEESRSRMSADGQSWAACKPDPGHELLPGKAASAPVTTQEVPAAGVKKTSEGATR